MKKLIIVLCLCLFLCGCGTGPVNDGNIPKGYTSYQQYYDKEGFMDYTDYCYYSYNNADAVKSNNNYVLLKKDEDGKETYLDKVIKVAEDFIGWMRALDRENELKFTLSDITEGDYAYIKENTYSIKTLYFFDTETNILHYMHNKN